MPTPAREILSMPFRKRKQRYTINPPDEVYNVIYLGNVLTIMAKGDASVEKPLSLIWKTYCTRPHRHDMQMKLTVTRSGLKAETKQQGLTEYWAHRITYCLAPREYPRVFCFVYKHEGKRMKPELRCHAVLCKKANEPAHIASTLQNYLQMALQEYKREKLAIEKARKNVASYGTCPRRKLMLQTGTLHFRPPVSRSKSAPRLGSIDEEDEELEEEEENELLVDDDENESFDLDSLDYHITPKDEDGFSTSSASTSQNSPNHDFSRGDPSTSTPDLTSTPSSRFKRQLSMTKNRRQQIEELAIRLGHVCTSDSNEPEYEGEDSDEQKSPATDCEVATTSSCSSDEGFASSSQSSEFHIQRKNSLRRRLKEATDMDGISVESGYLDSNRQRSKSSLQISRSLEYSDDELDDATHIRKLLDSSPNSTEVQVTAL